MNRKTMKSKEVKDSVSVSHKGSEDDKLDIVKGRLDAVEGEVEKLRELTEGNKGTYSMVTKALLKLDERLNKLEKLIAGALK